MDNSEYDRTETLITLTSDIVAAHVSNNSVSADEVSNLITNVYSALSGLGQPSVAEEPAREPAVSVRASIKPDYLVCLEDGKKLKMLRRYLRTNYNMSPEEYRERWNLPSDYPMVAPNYAETRRELAKKIGLGRKPGQKRGRRKKVA
jgi:predicted transcriptional regulator